MAHRLLLLRRSLGKRRLKRLVVKIWIIAETIGSTRRVDDFPRHLASKRAHHDAGLGQSNNANVSSRSVAHSAQFLEQQVVVVPIACGLAGKPRRVNTRRASQGIHLETGVFGKQQSRGMPAIVDSLLTGIFLEGAPRLFAMR